MSLGSRLRNALFGQKLRRELDDEFESHVAEAIENGRDPAEARAAFGSALRWREQSWDSRCAVWLEALLADLSFGWKQITKRKGTSAAAILSLGLGIGCCTAAFRLIDALLLRPLPVANPERLYLVAREGLGPGGDFRVSESCEYPLFETMRNAVASQAELLALSYAIRVDLTYSSDDEMEKAYRQYVSASMFSVLGLRPSMGRVLDPADDGAPGAHAVAVLSFDYWTRRFGRDPKVVGRTVRVGNDLLEIVGVGPERFTGTEPGIMVDLFVPLMMNPYVTRSDASWFRVLASVRPGVAMEPLRAKLHGLTRAFNEHRASSFTNATKLFVDRFLNQKVLLEPAPTGASEMQRGYQSALFTLGALVALVLLIACLNVANLMTAQAAARTREIALRISIGAGRWRLAQLVFAESLWIAVLAAILGAGFASWAAPFVVSQINAPNTLTRLYLPLDLRVTCFLVGLTAITTIVFGLAPALRASQAEPVKALKGGDDPHARRRLMLTLVAAQVAFCFVVHFAAGLFVTTFDRLANQPTGFESEGRLALDVSARRPQTAAAWDEIADHLRNVPGVSGVAIAAWPLLSGSGRNSFIWVDGAPTNVFSYVLAVSPKWTQVMGLRFRSGHDFRPADMEPGVAIVNDAFVRQCFNGRDPIGRVFEMSGRDRYEVVGVVNDARYRNMREPITPTAYVPFRQLNAAGEMVPKAYGSLIVSTSLSNPMILAPVLRKELAAFRPEFRISNIRTQTELNQQQTIRERLLARLALFFAAVALLLAGIGLYGVLDYSVLQRQRELGIRIAIGARPVGIVRLVTGRVCLMVLLGGLAGIGLGLLLTKYVSTLLYQVKGTDAAILAVPCLMITSVSALAVLPAVIRSLRIDPATLLRTD